MHISSESLATTSYLFTTYVGEENIARDFVHGNAKHNRESLYVRTCPSVLRNLEKKCITDLTSKVYKSEVMKGPPATHRPVLQPRNSKQVENIRYKQLESNVYRTMTSTTNMS